MVADGLDSMGSPTSLSLADILRNTDLQTRPVDAGWVRRLASAYKAGTVLPPITVVQIDQGPPMLLDGWHRVTALESLGCRGVDAEVIQAKDVAEARWLAMKANLIHGLPLKASQRREVFRAYMRADQWRNGKRAKSLREIAKDLGASHNTIASWMQKDFRRISREYYGGLRDEAGNSGGLRERRIATMRDLALNSLEATRQAFRGIKKPEERGEVIAKLEEVLDAMRKSRGWKPWQPEDF